MESQLHGLEGTDRFRANVHLQKGSVEAAFRRIPTEIPRYEDLGLPEACRELARKFDGTRSLSPLVSLLTRQQEVSVVDQLRQGVQ